MEGFQIRQKLTKYAKKLGKMRQEWVISLAFCPPFVKIRRYTAQFVIFDPKSLQIVTHEPMKIDILLDKDSFDDEMRRYRQEVMYKAYIAYTLNDSSVVKNIS